MSGFVAGAAGVAVGNRRHRRVLLPAALVGLAVAAVVAGTAQYRAAPTKADPTPLVSLPAGTFAYRAAGEFLRDGVPIDAPSQTAVVDRPLAIMKRQVGRAEYDRCAAARACRPLDDVAGVNANTVPAVGLSWTDATAYATWLSRQTGHRYRLPTDTEWAYAAGTAYRGEPLAGEGDAANPAKRWLSTYEKESAATPLDPSPLAFGAFGTNANSVQDMNGHVGEWTDTCFVRHATSATGTATALESCGVRVVEGSHRTYMSDFIRNPRGGACSVGAPPANLGVRLVRDDG